MAWTVPSEYMLQACVRLLFLLLIFWQILIKHSLPSISFASGGDGVSQKERERGGGREPSALTHIIRSNTKYLVYLHVVDY